MVAWFSPLAVSVALAAAQTPAPETCLKALREVPAGSVLDSAEFARATCPAARSNTSFRYDRSHHETRATRALLPGEVVRAFSEFGRGVVHPGDKVELLSRAGAVRIFRQVEALQAAAPGQRLFVKTAEGEILSVRFEAEGK